MRKRPNFIRIDGSRVWKYSEMLGRWIICAHLVQVFPVSSIYDHVDA